MKSCSFIIAAEQKARVTYDNILRLADDPDVRDPIKFLRQREIVHYQRFGEAKQSRWNVEAELLTHHLKSRFIFFIQTDNLISVNCNDEVIYFFCFINF